MYSQTKEIKNTAKIDISSRNKVGIENHYLCFFNVAIEANLDKRMFFFFYNQISFSFSFSCPFLIGTFKKIEYICNVFTVEVF